VLLCGGNIVRLVDGSHTTADYSFVRRILHGASRRMRSVIVAICGDICEWKFHSQISPKMATMTGGSLRGQRCVKAQEAHVAGMQLLCSLVFGPNCWRRLLLLTSCSVWTSVVMCRSAGIT
jgi:hypothetical protein